METAIDPPATSTHQLFTDAFNILVQTKDFSNISVKAITELETVNRATFYAYSVYKYTPLKYVLTDIILRTMDKHFAHNYTFKEQTVGQIFLPIVSLHNNMYAGCRRGYNTFSSIIEELTKKPLTFVVLRLQSTIKQNRAALFSWSMYGAYVEWYTFRKRASEQYVKQVTTMLYSFVLKA